jgi:hypothetical protein
MARYGGPPQSASEIREVTMAAGVISHPTNTITTVFAVTIASLAFCGTAAAQSQLETRLADAVRKIEAACSNDLKKYCSTVTPGDSRLILCMQAHEDQISSKCDYALFEASRNLGRTLDRVGQIADVCWDDIKRICSLVPEGGWRIPQCLASQRLLLTPACQTQIGDPAAQDVRPQRIKIEIIPPTSPEHQQVYDLINERRPCESAGVLRDIQTARGYNH